MTSRSRRLLVLCSLLLMLPVTAAGQNVGIRDVPLKPWTGFAKNWDWTYDALQKLVLSGLAGRVVMNSKPMSRREMALIVADIVQRIQDNKVFSFDHRADLQDTLLALMDEFSPELLALGLKGQGINGQAPRTLEVKPIDHLQIQGGYTGHATDLENRNGERLDRGMNGRVTTDSWVEAGGVFAAYAQPEFRIGEDTLRGQLTEGYAKGRLGPVELLAGRESLWWGPGYHGSMLFSNNAPAFNMVRIQSANQFYLPWVFEELGPMKLQLFYGRLEEGRTFYPQSQITGGRIDMTPFPWLEVGLGRSLIFDGRGRPGPRWYEYPEVWWHGNQEGTENDRTAADNRFHLDTSFRMADIGKYIGLTRDAELYVDFGWDDTCCGSPIIPIKPGEIVGLYLPNLFLSPDTTFRVEYSRSSTFQFTHSVWQDGYSRKGHVISDFEGTNGQDLFFRLTQRLDPKLEIGIELDFARRGQTQKGLELATKERRSSLGVDVSYKHSNALSMNFEARLERAKNRDFAPASDDFNEIFLVSATYNFAPEIGSGPRTTLAPGALAPLSPPPRVPDPDQILSWEYAGKVVSDSGTVLTSPFRWEAKDWLIAGGVAAAAGGAMLLDKTVRDFAQDHQSHSGRLTANNLSNFAFIGPAVGAVGSYIAGEVFHNEAAKQRAADGVEAAFISELLITYPMKFLLGRSRPDKEQGSQSYHPFNISGSMPSSHTTAAFTAASVASEHMDNPWVSALVYGLATAVGGARIYEDKHWFSDVVVSAAIGTAVGKAVVALNRNRRNSNVSVIPLASKDLWGAAVQVKY